MYIFHLLLIAAMWLLWYVYHMECRDARHALEQRDEYRKRMFAMNDKYNRLLGENAEWRHRAEECREIRLRLVDELAVMKNEIDRLTLERYP